MDPPRWPHQTCYIGMLAEAVPDEDGRATPLEFLSYSTRSGFALFRSHVCLEPS